MTRRERSTGSRGTLPPLILGRTAGPVAGRGPALPAGGRGDGQPCPGPSTVGQGGRASALACPGQFPGFVGRIPVPGRPPGGRSGCEGPPGHSGGGGGSRTSQARLISPPRRSSRGEPGPVSPLPGDLPAGFSHVGVYLSGARPFFPAHLGHLLEPQILGHPVCLGPKTSLKITSASLLRTFWSQRTAPSRTYSTSWPGSARYGTPVPRAAPVLVTLTGPAGARRSQGRLSRPAAPPRTLTP